MNKIKAFKWHILGGIIGSSLGYAYYYFIGCESGTCRITSSPINSTLYGLLMGILFINLFDSSKK